MPSPEWLGLSTDVDPTTCYLSNNINFFTSGLIPVDADESYLHRLRTAVLEVWGSGVNALPSIVSLFDRRGLDTMTVQVDKEIQFNSWIFKQVNAELEGQGFIIDEDKINKVIVPNVCEFSSSKPDCVIYHPTSLCTNNTLVGFAISVSEDEEEPSDVERVITKGCSFEVKKKELNNAAIK